MDEIKTVMYCSVCFPNKAVDNTQEAMFEHAQTHIVEMQLQLKEGYTLADLPIKFNAHPKNPFDL